VKSRPDLCFQVYRQDYGGLEEYLIMGKTLKETVRIYADLAGMPLLVPRWYVACSDLHKHG